MFGAMFASAALHGTGTIHAVVPPWVANTAMVALGGVIGARFANTPPRLLANYLGAALRLLRGGGGGRRGLCGCLSKLLPVPIAEVMIAFAPGSVDAMMLLALALHVDPVYVGAHHLVRIVSWPVAVGCRSRARWPCAPAAASEAQAAAARQARRFSD